MTFMLITAALLTGAPRPAVGALEAFNTGQLYLLTTETCSDTPPRPVDFHPPGVPSFPFQLPPGGGHGIMELRNAGTLERDKCPGNELHSKGRRRVSHLRQLHPDVLELRGRVDIPIMPEELWTVLSHCRRPAPPSTGQISMEAWYPGLEGPVTSFVATYTPAMPVIQTLLERGRQAIQPE